MAHFLYRLGKWSYLNRLKVIVTWVLLLVGMGAAAASLSKPFTADFAISGTPAIDAIDALDEKFPGAGDSVNAATINLVFQAPQGETLDQPKNSQAMQSVVSYIDTHLKDITSTDRFGNPLEVSPRLQKMIEDREVEAGLPIETARADAAQMAMISQDRTIAYTTFDVDVPTAQAVTDEHRRIINEALDVGREQGLRVEGGGAGFGDPIKIKKTSEVIGIIIAFIVLIFMFASVIAAVMPVVTALVGVGLGMMALFTGTHWVILNDTTPVLAVMIGLAVGIDYSLFILSRYRLERNRLPGPEAAGLANGTAGSSVVFAGVTVFVALAALTIARIEFLSWMGIAAATTVFIAVLVALTLTPALLGLFKDKAFGWRVWGRAKRGRRQAIPAKRDTMGVRWVSFVYKIPALIVAAVVLGLGAMSIPVSKLEMALPSDMTSGYDTTQRQAAELMAEGFGPGINAPLLLVINAENVNPDSPALSPLVSAQQLQAARAGETVDKVKAAQGSTFLYTLGKVNALSEVRHVQLIAQSDDGTAAQVAVFPQSGPADKRTAETAHSIRSIGEEVSDATGADIGLTGLTAVQMDITERLANAMPVYLGVVVGLAIILLMLVFRSIMVPVVAGLGFLLSVGASFGLTVLVWQEGLFGLVPTPAPLISFMPIFLIGVTFGLAMDYQVFLVTRMREHFNKHGGRPTPGSIYTAVEESVIVGFGQTARVVTAAAIIMIAVFVAFVDQPLPFIQIFGFALGFSVLFDAFFVRMALVPATMFLMGRATWWMPRWLDRILPDIDVEGTQLEKKFEGLNA